MRKRVFRGPAGFTLVEVLVAVTIILVALVALSWNQLFSLSITREARDAAEATQIANERLELLRQKVLADFVTYSNCPVGDACSSSETVGRYGVAYAVSNESSYMLRGLVRIELDVTGPKSVSLEHYVSCMDLSPPPTVLSSEECEG